MRPSIRWDAKRNALLVVLVLVGACGGGAEEVGAGRRAAGTDGAPQDERPVREGEADEFGNPLNPETEVRACESVGMGVLFAPLGINTLANLSDAAVVGTFESVGAARRDERIGGVYGEARFRVDRTVFDSAQLRTRPGDVLTLRLLARDECGVESYEAISGPVAQQQRSFLLVDHLVDRGENNINYLRNWRVVRGADGQEHARSTDPRRDAPLDQVIRRVAEERAAGRDAGRDKGTEERPFG